MAFDPDLATGERRVFGRDVVELSDEADSQIFGVPLILVNQFLSGLAERQSFRSSGGTSIKDLPDFQGILSKQKVSEP